MLRVINSNRMEELVSALCERLAEPLPSPLSPELLVVPTPAMGQWLRLRLADHFGVCANIEFLYPANFIWEVFRRVLGDALPAAAPFSPEANAWRVYQALGSLPPTPAQATLRAYLQAGDARHRFDLAREIARCFDQYLVFRPDWIRRWEAGEDGHWQAELWRGLVAGRRPLHWVHALQDFGRRLASDEALDLPARATLVGVPALSPGYLEVMARLAERMSIDALVLNPCAEYWGDIVSPGTVAAAAPAQRHYLDTGHRLLASMGRPGRDFLDRLIEIAADDEPRFVPPDGTSLLALLQADMLHLRDRDGHDLPRLPVAADDESLQIHDCHSPMREVEVLHDQLLAMFERWPDLLPSQVLVAVTDFDRYGPFLEAFFAAVDDARYIPLSPISRLRLDREPLVEVFLSMLELPRSRLAAEAVLAPLELPAVGARFGLDEDDVARLRDWVSRAGIRWGWDAAHRAEQQLPADPQNTWMAGLDRLLLGYALPGDGMQLFAGVLPCDAVEGLAAATLSRLLRYLETLNRWRRELSRARPMAAWGQWLLDVIDDLYAVDEDDDARDVVQGLRDQVVALSQEALAGECTEPLAAEAVVQALRHRLAAPPPRPSPLRGGVCVADLTAARALPFEVVCVLGMSDGAFPRVDRRVDFDLLRDDWRRGDRSRRDDDRYLFLETMLSARRCLYLSFVGRDQRSGSVLPPSVLVSELLDVASRGFVMDDGGELLRHILRRHPLHGFSTDYFIGRRDLFTYRQAYCIDPRGARHATPPLLSSPLPLPATLTLTPARLAEFFCHPVRALIEDRYRIRMRDEDDHIDDDEPFQATRQQVEALRARLAQCLVAGHDAVACHAIESARGDLPFGQVGRIAFSDALADARRLAASMQAWISPSPLRAVEVDLLIDGVRIAGPIEGVGELGLLHCRAVPSINIWQTLRTWVLHLSLLVGEPSLPGTSRILTLDGSIVFHRPPAPDRLLADLVTLYRQGICAPLPFFPACSDVWMRARRAQGAGGADADNGPLTEALKRWSGNAHQAGEGSDRYLRLAFGDHVPIDRQFEAVSERVLGPMLDAMESGA